MHLRLRGGPASSHTDSGRTVRRRLLSQLRRRQVGSSRTEGRLDEQVRTTAQPSEEESRIMLELTVTGRLARSPFANRRRQKDTSPPPPPESQAATLPPGPTRLARMLALAYHVERLIDAGDLDDHADAAQRFGITRAGM